MMAVDSVFVFTVVGTGIGIILAMGGLVLTLFLWTRGEGNADRRAMAEETKDFHKRLAKQEAEFLAFMKKEEEKRTKILMERRS